MLEEFVKRKVPDFHYESLTMLKIVQNGKLVCKLTASQSEDHQWLALIRFIRCKVADTLIQKNWEIKILAGSKAMFF